MRVLVACEYSGRTREAFRARGHDVLSCDLLPAEDDSDRHVIADVFSVIDAYPKGYFDLMIAHPPCTYLANSGVRWLYSGGERDGSGINRDREAKMLEGAAFFAKLLQQPIAKIAVENPVMHKYGRKAIEYDLGEPMNTHFVQPWWFGDPAFKATGFTLKGLPPLKKPDTALVPPKPGTDEHKEWSAIHRASPGPNRWKERSRTFPGVAQAMAETWG